MRSEIAVNHSLFRLCEKSRRRLPLRDAGAGGACLERVINPHALVIAKEACRLRQSIWQSTVDCRSRLGSFAMTNRGKEFHLRFAFSHSLVCEWSGGTTPRSRSPLRDVRSARWRTASSSLAALCSRVLRSRCVRVIVYFMLYIYVFEIDC